MSNGSFKVGELFARLRSSIACQCRTSLRDDVAMPNYDFVDDPFRTVFRSEFALFDRSFDKHVFALFECRSKLVSVAQPMNERMITVTDKNAGTHADPERAGVRQEMGAPPAALLPLFFWQAPSSHSLLGTFYRRSIMRAVQAINDFVSGRRQWLLSVTVGYVLLFAPAAPSASEHDPGTTWWRADHHMHIASAEVCRLITECVSPRNPPAVFASDVVSALDAAHISKGVVLSTAYLYGLPSLHLEPPKITAGTRRENEFTAAEVKKYPDRLVGFLSVNPLQASAIDEIRYWRGSRELIGLKLHFTASAVHMRSAADRIKVARIIAEAASERIPVVIHIGGGEFSAADAEPFIRDVLPSAKDSWVQIAHAGGGMPLVDGNHVDVLRAFANHIVHDDPLTRQVLFDLSVVPASDESPAVAAELAQQIRRLGTKRFLFGCDFPVQTPANQIESLRTLGLTTEEWRTLKGNCAPWTCGEDSSHHLAR
jgi:uncharacterized protein